MIVKLFIAAFTAELIGVHEVVGAFLAGLAVNSMLPRHSPVAGHVLFIGESFFIPVFLLYSGLITGPLTFLESPQTIIVALVVTVVAYVSKLIATWITAKIYKYTQSEFLTVYGLSHAQAAVTIPALVIGMETGLFDSTLFNAAILMILLPVSEPGQSESLITLASLLARTSHGKIVFRCMFEANLVIAKALGVPLIIRADKSYLQAVESLVHGVDSNQPIRVEPLDDPFRPTLLEKESISSFVVVHGFGSRKRVADTLGNLPEQIASFFDGNLTILHFDR